MIIYPAIDIRNGRCVRLTEGRFDRETVYFEDPAEVALRWQSQGAGFLHLVDLDGALAGESRNLPTLRRILAQVSIPVQVGGGIRSLAAMEKLFSLGVARVIIGSAAVREPQLVAEACRLYPGRIAVGIDAREGRVAIGGWKEEGGLTATELAQAMAAYGVSTLIFTDIARDGCLSGVNAPATAALAQACGLPVIASGGLASLEDIKTLLGYGEAIAGCIIGKALYSGAVSLREALALAAGKEAPAYAD